MTAGMVFRARWRRGCCSAKLVFSRAARYLGGMALCALALGVQGGPVNRPQDDANPRTAQQWMERMQGASRSRSYVGTVVVLHASGAMAASKIWHAVRDGQQFERVDALDGAASTVYRQDGLARTFLHQSRTVRTERRELLHALPGSADATFVPPYTAHLLGQERVAGMEADVVSFAPHDALRFGYRFWSERTSGLVLRVQMLEPSGRVLEQTAFSALQLDADKEAQQWARMPQDTAGYQDLSVQMRMTTATEQGWGLREPVDGFVPVGCYLHAVSSAGHEPGLLQCFYSDGLVTVSLFIERHHARRSASTVVQVARGATHVLAKPLSDGVWLTAVGEVPAATLVLFADRLARLK